MTNYINDIPNQRNDIYERGNNNNDTQYNMFCSYIYLKIPLNKEGIIQYNNTSVQLTGESICHRKFSQLH